ncbi:MAG: hypothetical protein KAX16_01440 [Actinomycetia bacterium]|nr:hypothetical protein [Actinomycetes bacterium]
MSSLFLPVFGAAIKHAPFRRAIIDLFGYLQAWRSFKIKRHHLGTIETLRRGTGSALPASLFALKYFIQRGKDNAWAVAFSEAFGSLEKYLIIENKEQLVQAVSLNKGALLLGAHYGPPIYTNILERLGFDLRTLVSEENYRALKNPRRTGALSSAKSVSFLRDTHRLSIAGKSEKGLIRHLKGGGVVNVLLDSGTIQKTAGVAVDFLGKSTRFSYFPFKVSIKYDVPVFFCFFAPAAKGGYRLRLIRVDGFSDPEEGVSKYVSFLESQIKVNPFMWRIV